jgi:hypothetical protein
LVFKWIRSVFRCWQDRIAYDESKYLARRPLADTGLAGQRESPPNRDGAGGGEVRIDEWMVAAEIYGKDLPSGE